MEMAENEIKAFLDRFMEHMTPCAIRVFVTMKEADNCMGHSIGRGDFYSIAGYVGEWLEIQHERTRVATRREDRADGE